MSGSISRAAQNGTLSVIEDFLEGIKSSCDLISRVAVKSATDLLFEAWRRGNSVFVIGNGGSASTATHFACDLTKNVAGVNRGIRAMSLSDNIPLVSALTNDNGFENVYTEQLKTWLDKDDVLVVISVHGGSGKDKAGAWSQNLIRAITFAESRGAKTIGLTGFDGGVMRDLVDVWINVPSDATFEVEPLHVIVHHVICECLKQRINAFSSAEV
jgi:D-sedoheptulose 7-phosphate isomerase